MTATLMQGHNYYVSAYVSAGDRCQYITDDIGFYFSTDSIDPDSDFVFQYIPQVENPEGNMLSDTLIWMLISGSFIANGGEQWIIIGNFKDDAHTTLDTLANWIVDGAYYYIDDVSVIDCTATGILVNNAIQFQLQNNPATSSLQFTSALKLNRCYVYDMLGNLVFDYRLNSNTTYTVSVADLKQGMYLLVVEDKDRRRGVKKFVKQ